MPVYPLLYSFDNYTKKSSMHGKSGFCSFQLSKMLSKRRAKLKSRKYMHYMVSEPSMCAIRPRPRQTEHMLIKPATYFPGSGFGLHLGQGSSPRPEQPAIYSKHGVYKHFWIWRNCITYTYRLVHIEEVEPRLSPHFSPDHWSCY
jgi:hypothetical protein